jgi:arylformamidase
LVTIDDEFLDREYNPRSQIPEFASFFSRWKMTAIEARKSLDAQLDVSFGSSPHQTLDYFPASSRHAPLMIFIHGGYWRALDKADFSWVAPPYINAGISIAVLNYGLVPGTPIGKIVEQIRDACVWAYRNCETLDVDPNRIFCSGHSAGGHLTAMMLATDWPAVQQGLPTRLLAGAITVSGLFDLEPLTRAEFLRRDLALDSKGARGLSPYYLALHNDTPLLRAVGALESNEFHRQSALIEEQWPTVCDRPLIDVPGCNHFSVCDALAIPGNILFETICSTVLRSSIS